MMPAEPRLTDWQRLLVGNAPFPFLFEVLARLLLVYAVLAVVMRLLGKRMSGQLSNAELAVMLLLGAIVGAPLTIPQRGIVPGVLLLALLLAFHRGLNRLGAHSRKVDSLSQGKATLLLKEGRLLSSELASAGISNEQFFSGLRAKQVTHLGELKRVYFEAHGAYSLIRAEPPKPGLTVQPASDLPLQQSLPVAPGLFACSRCGNVVDAAEKCGRCAHCDGDDWSAAVTGGSPKDGAASEVG
jgi:uncharacterized membrane protein YcaP (DUF421 family)